MGTLSRTQRAAGRKILRRATKGIPFVGAAVALAFLADTVRRKGVVNGVLDTAFDVVPFVGALKFGVELFRGDWFPDRENAGVTPPSTGRTRRPLRPVRG